MSNPRSVTDALAWTTHQGRFKAGMCKMMCRLAYNVPSDGSPDATAAWGRTKHRGTGPAPKGALHWWTGGRSGHGHVAIDATGGSTRIRTTDLPSSGQFGTMPLDAPARLWGLRYVGWSRDIDGVLVVPYPPKPASRLAQLRAQLRRIATDKAVGPVRRRRAARAAGQLDGLS